MSSHSDMVDRARAFHGRYPKRGRNVFLFLLEAFCLPLEVFLHSRMGLRYLTLPKAAVGLVFPFICMLLIDFGVDFQPSFRPWNIGFVRAYPIVHLPPSWGDFCDDFRRTYDNFFDLITNSGWGQSADLTLLVLFAYIICANLRWLELQWRERFRDLVHPRSSGDPYSIWNPAYWLLEKFNFQSDLVKQLGEPLLCILLSIALNHFLKLHSALSESTAASLKFISVWLGFGGTLLMVKAAIENRSRYVSEYDRRASEMDSEAFEAGDPGIDDNPMSVTTVQRR